MAQSTSQKTIIPEALKREFTTETGRPKNYTIKMKNGPIYTGNNLSDGGVSITESLSSNNSFDLAAVEKPTIEFTLLNLERNISLLKGREVELAITVGSMAMPAGTYLIDNAEKQNDHLYNIKASGMLAKFNQDVSDWWNKEVQFPITHRDLLISLCNKVGMDYQLPQTYTNSNVVISHRNMYVNGATGATFLGYLQEMSGCFFTTSRMLDNGRTLTIKKITQPTGTSSMQYTGTHYIGTVEVADYSIKKIDMLQIRATKDDVGVVAGDKGGQNAYIIEGNPLLYGMGSTELQPIAEAVYNEIKDIQYIPFTANVMGLPFVEVGDHIQFRTPAGAVIDTVLMKRTFAGTQFFKDNLEAKGKEIHENASKPARTMTILNQKMHEFSVTVEDLKSKIKNIGTSSDRVVSIEHFFLYNNGTKPAEDDEKWTKTPGGTVPAGMQMWEKIVTHYALHEDEVTIINMSDNSVVSIDPEYFESLSITEPIDDYIYPNAELFPSYTLYPVTKHNKGWQPEPYDRVGYCRLTRSKYTYKDGTVKYKDPIKDDQFNQAIYAFNQQSMYLQEKIETNTTNIEQTNKKIVLQAENIRQYQSKNAEDIIKLNTKISTTAEQIELEAKSYVKKDGLITQINSSYKQSAEKIDIQAINIDLSGYVTFKSLSEEGSTAINGSNIKTGTITAVDIFGSNIEGSSITFRNGDKYITATGNTDAFNNTHGILFKGNGDFTISANEFTISRSDDNGTGIYTWFHAAGDSARNDVQLIGGITGHQESLRLGSDYFSIGDRNIGLYRDSGSKYVTLATVGGNGKLKFYYKDGIYYVIGVTDNEFQNR